MEQIGKIQLSPSVSLARRSQGTIQTSKQSSAVELLRQAGAMEWEVALFQLAQDKRHDLAPDILPWWREKLKAYPDPEIREALGLYSGQFFPSVDDITTLIERRRKRAAEIRQELYWVDYERNNRDIGKFMREHDGKTPQQVYCEENREEIERLNAKLFTRGEAHSDDSGADRSPGKLCVDAPISRGTDDIAAPTPDADAGLLTDDRIPPNSLEVE